MQIYQKELEMISAAVKEAYHTYGGFKKDSVSDKAKFDLVTEADYNIEKYLIDCIKKSFPEDRILSEETGFDTKIQGRTWTVDPIDGTVNMARGIRMFGVQCAMFEDSKPVVSVIWLPVLNELYTAAKGRGAFLNGEKITVCPTENQRAIVSFGDFPHRRLDDFTDEHRLLFTLSAKIARIRMFGSAAVDFACLACGKTNATVLFTKNQWDLAPGTLLCLEAGGVIGGLEGEYTLASRAVIAAADEKMLELIRSCY